LLSYCVKITATPFCNREALLMSFLAVPSGWQRLEQLVAPRLAQVPTPQFAANWVTWLWGVHPTLELRVAVAVKGR
jgi:hypothetical protein